VTGNAAKVADCATSSANIYDIIRRHAAVMPERPALIEGSRIICYAELAQTVAKQAGYLATLGVRKGDRVGLLLKDHADHFMLMLAAALLGAASVSPNWRAKLDEKQLIAKLFGLRLLIFDPDVRAPAGVPALPLDEQWNLCVSKSSLHEPVPAAGDLPFRILLTSGTSGAPKGVELTHAQAFAWRDIARTALNLTTPHRHLSILPLAFTGATMLNLPHIILGNTIELASSLVTPEEFVALVKNHAITGATVVPTIVRRLLRLAGPGAQLLPELDYLVCLGSPLSAGERRDAVNNLTRGFVDNYGASGSGPVTFMSAADIERCPDSIGRPVVQTQVEVVDEKGRPCPAGEIGRLRCRGPAAARGFCGSSSGAAGELFDDGWYYPGDLAKMDADGFIYLAGRAADIVIHGGSNVYPVEIERVLMRHPGVRDVSVVGVPSEEYGEDVVAFVECSSAVAERDLLEACRRHLSPYKIPKRIVFLDELPRSPAGKVQKQQLLDRFLEVQSATARA